MTEHAARLAAAREDIERAIIEARLHDDPAAPILHALGSVLAALEPLALAVAQPTLLSPEAERALIRETSKAITRETWRQLAIHVRDIRFVTWVLAALAAGALFATGYVVGKLW